MVGFSAGIDQATVAFRRLLAEANSNEQTRVDALVVLAQRTVFAATWPGQGQAVRTLTNREGETAMPLFTGHELLEETARRFGWMNPDGSLSCRELGAREALRHALGRGVHFVVLDMGSDHAVEFAREEIEPLLQLQNQKSGGGPFAAAGEPQAAILDAVRRSTRPPPSGGAISRIPAAPRTPSVEIDLPFANLKEGSAQGASEAPARRPSLPAGAQGRAVSQPLTQARRTSVRPSRPPQGALQALDVAAARSAAQPTAALPEVRPPSIRAPAVGIAAERAAEEMSKLLLEGAGSGDAPAERQDTALSAGKPMAALFLGDANAANDDASRGPGEQAVAESSADAVREEALQAISNALRAFPEVEWACTLAEPGEGPAVGVRVDPSFLNRVADITDAICDASEKHGQQLQMLLLNTPELVKNARKQGRAFYPWKR